MLGAYENKSGEVRASDQRRKYLMPRLSRYGTLADLTKSNGNKNGNDSGGVGEGCGQGGNFLFSSCSNL